MAERPESLVALEVLRSIDADLFHRAQCWFGGGTAVSLRCGEHRLSRDVEFLCSDSGGYKLLRERLFQRGVSGLFRTPLAVARDARADRYGIRFAVVVSGTPVKVEIVSEGRIRLDGVSDPDLPLERLTDVDLVAEKLLANTDRSFDDAALGRDVVDLVVLEDALGGLPAAAWEKAQRAYGEVVRASYDGALARLRDRPDVRDRWFSLLDLSPRARAVVERRLAALG